MRFVVLLVLLGCLVSASTLTAPLDQMAYNLVKDRGQPPQLAVFIPSFSYTAYKGYQVVVLAIPYSPDDEAMNNLLKELPGKILEATTKNNWGDLYNLFTQFRNIYYPYETFKIKLIFIIFTQTQTILDTALDSIATLLEENKNNNQDKSGATYFATSIITLINGKFERNQGFILNEINKNINFVKQNVKTTLDISESSPQCGDSICNNTIKLIFTIKYPNLSWSKSFETSIYVQYNSSTHKILQCNLNNSAIKQGLSGLSSEALSEILKYNEREVSLIFKIIYLNKTDLKKVFVGANNSFIEKFGISLNSTLDNWLRGIYQSNSNRANESLLKKLNQYLDLSKMCKNSNIDQFRTYISNLPSIIDDTIKSSYENTINSTFRDVGDQLSVVNDLMRFVKDEFKANIKDSINNLDKLIDEFDKLGNEITDRVVSNTLDCITMITKDQAADTVGSIISSAPPAAMVYALANGIYGALQKQITIRGSVSYSYVNYLPGTNTNFPKGLLLNVSRKAICLPGAEVRLVTRSEFVSQPSPTEAIFAGIVGFFSSVSKAFGAKGLGDALDLIPIIREVDIPQNGYFMTTSSPSIYQLEINIDVKNFIENFINEMKESTRQTLKKVNEQIGKQSASDRYELYNRIVNTILENKEDIIDLIKNGRNKTNEIYKDVYSQISDIKSDPTGGVTMYVYLISLSPYPVGEKSSDVVKYSYVYDWFSLLRPGLNIMLSNLISKSQSFCSGQQGFSNLQVGISQQVSSLCNELLDNTINTIVNKLIVAPSFKGEDDKNAKCSIQGLIKLGVSTVANNFVNRMKNYMTDYISTNIIQPLCNTVSSNVDNFSKMMPPGGFAAFNEYLSLFGAFRSSEGNAGSMPEPESSPRGGLRDLLCSLYGQNEALLYSFVGTVNDYLYLPSYFLSRYSIRPPDSSAVRMCYAVVVSPYFVYPYQRFEVSTSNFRKVVIDYAELIGQSDAGEALFDAVSNKDLTYTINLWIINIKFNLIKFYKDNNNKYVVQYLELFKTRYDDLVSLYKSDKFIRYVSLIDDNTINDILNTEHRGKTVKVLLEDLLSAYVQDWRGVKVGVSGGVNKYFSAFKVHPAVAVRDLGDLNAYYFVIPYSASARELFVLGKVGSTVLYDGSQPAEGKPFVYVDLVGER